LRRLIESPLTVKRQLQRPAFSETNPSRIYQVEPFPAAIGAATELLVRKRPDAI